MQHRIPHALSGPLARLVTARALDSYVKRYPEFKPEGRWTAPDRAEFRLSAKGAKVDGNISVERDAVVFDLDFPLLLKPFQGTVVKMVDEEVQTWIRWATEGRFDHEVPPEAAAKRR